ncbi:trans-sialidase, putative, partial [Trypanosoma cruzi]
MSLSILFLFISAMHLRCTVLFVRPFTCSAPVFTSLLRVSAGTHNHMHAQNTDCSVFGCFFCSVCWGLRVAAASSVGMKGRRREGAHAARHFCCWRDAPPVTSLSRAPNPIVGVMTGNFVATSWMDADPLLRVALWVITGTVSVVCWLRGRGHI